MNNRDNMNAQRNNNHSFSNSTQNNNGTKHNIRGKIPKKGAKIAKKVNPLAGAAINAGKKITGNNNNKNSSNNPFSKNNSGLKRNGIFGQGMLGRATGKKMNETNKEEEKNEENQAESSISSSVEVGSASKKIFVTILMAIIAILQIILIILALLAPLIMLIAAIIAIISIITSLFGGGGSGSGGLATAGYYNIQCNEVTVIFTDKRNNYETTGSGTYSIEDYVAGVIDGEVDQFNNIEVYKEFAIAARTYFLRNESNCTIESSDRKQVFRETSNSLAKQAANETKGQVLLDQNGALMSTEYDAFCSIDIDDEYYTIKQKNQRIPITWVESQPGIISEWKQGNCTDNHGRGASQWGSYYLATEKGYNYQQLLDYYYSDDSNPVSISNQSFTSSIAGLEIKETRNASYQLNQPINSFLNSKGSSLNDYNNFIKQSVVEAGVGTRAGVVTAAVSMINYLYDNFDAKLPYYWGGASQEVGIPQKFGNQINSMPSVSGKIYKYVSFDCSGFVSWAIRNGGYKFSRQLTSGFDNLFGKESCDITSEKCKGQPGDLINSRTSHIKMIVSVDEANNRYYVAESTTNGVIIQTHGMHTPMHDYEPTKILHMDSFYNNPNNIDTNY